VVEPRSCSLYHRGTSNASKPAIGKAVQRLRHTPASFAGAQVQLCQSFDGRVSLDYRDTRLQHTIRGGHLYGAVRVTNSRCYNTQAERCSDISSE
jgi:hypothetical protein